MINKEKLLTEIFKNIRDIPYFGITEDPILFRSTIGNLPVSINISPVVDISTNNKIYIINIRSCIKGVTNSFGYVIITDEEWRDIYADLLSKYVNKRALKDFEL